MQTNQPPAATARGQGRNDDAEDHADDAALPRPPAVLGIAQHDADAPSRAEHEHNRLEDVVPPAPVADVSAKHGKEAEYLEAEERQAKDLVGLGQSAGENGRGHEGGVGGQRGRELGAHAARVVKEEDVDGEKPEGYGPDGIAGCGPREGLEDRRQPQ